MHPIAAHHGAQLVCAHGRQGGHGKGCCPFAVRDGLLGENTAAAHRKDYPMAAVCDFCGKKPSFGMSVSHAHGARSAAGTRTSRRVRALVNGAPERLRLHLHPCPARSPSRFAGPLPGRPAEHSARPAELPGLTGPRFRAERDHLAPPVGRHVLIRFRWRPVSSLTGRARRGGSWAASAHSVLPTKALERLVPETPLGCIGLEDPDLQRLPESGRGAAAA